MLLSLLFLVRILPAFRFLLIFLLVALLVVLGIYLFGQSWLEARRKRAYAKTTPGQMEARITHCEDQIQKHQAEQERIRQSIDDLKKKLAASPSLPSAVIDETRHLIRQFEQEVQLRSTKVDFFRECKRKLEHLLQQHRLLSELESKKKELEDLREQHYEDVAAMENLRWDVEREGLYLETIQELSQRMQHSNELEDVLDLQKELAKMTREIGE